MGVRPHTLWFVLRLSICFRNTIIHRSLQMNLITSRVSTILERSLENLSPPNAQHHQPNTSPPPSTASSSPPSVTYLSTSPWPTLKPSCSRR